MTLVKGTKPLTNITKSSVLEVARVPLTPLVTVFRFFLTHKFLKNHLIIKNLVNSNSKYSKYTLKKRQNMFKVNNKNARTWCFYC